MATTNWAATQRTAAARLACPRPGQGTSGNGGGRHDRDRHPNRPPVSQPKDRALAASSTKGNTTGPPSEENTNVRANDRQAFGRACLRRLPPMPRPPGLLSPERPAKDTSPASSGHRQEQHPAGQPAPEQGSGVEGSGLGVQGSSSPPADIRSRAVRRPATAADSTTRAGCRAAAYPSRSPADGDRENNRRDNPGFAIAPCIPGHGDQNGDREHHGGPQATSGKRAGVQGPGGRVEGLSTPRGLLESDASAWQPP